MSNQNTAVSTQVVSKEDREIIYQPFGTTDELKLNISIIRNLIAVPTKRGVMPSDADCVKFMMLCKGKRMDPFGGDCYMLGYDAQDGAQFTLITAHQVYLKRAEASPSFDGMESGVIVAVDGNILEREGDFTFKGEELLGGWAKVYRRDRSRPMYRRLKLATFSTGRSRWNADPAGMIVKCAEADALRSTFPTLLGGLYMQEERPEIVLEQEKVIPKARFGQPAPTPALEAPKTVVKMPPVPVEAEAVEEERHEPATPQAAASATVTPPDPKPAQEAAKPAPAGPSADSLRKTLYAKGAALNIGKKVLPVKLAQHGFLGDDVDLETLDANGLANILDSWSEFEDAIRNPEGAR